MSIYCRVQAKEDKSRKSPYLIKAPSPTTLLITTTLSNPLSTTSSPSTSPSILSQKSVSNPSNSTPIIAGAIVGGIVIMCLTMAVFCCFRFRQKKKQAKEKMFAEPESPDAETVQFYSTNGKTLQSPRTKKKSKSSSGGELVLGDDLTPFGGRKSNSSSDKASSPVTSAPVPAMTQSQIPAPVHPVYLKQSIHAVQASPILESSEDYESDRPLAPDPEKSSLTPPPESSHPAFHPLPGMASTRPAYRPRMDFTINELDGREINHVPFGTAGGRGSDGAVSAMSTPSQPSSNDNGRISEMSSPSFPHLPSGPQTQANWHAQTKVLLPGQPTSIQSQYQTYHRRGNSHSNNGSAGSCSNLTNPPQQTYAQTQYLRQQAQIQYHRQIAQARRMHVDASQDPYQMYTERLEHERVQAQARVLPHVQTNSGEVMHEQNTGISHQETSNHSIPIELGIAAHSPAQHNQFSRSPLAPSPSTSTAISQSQLRALHSPQQREQQQHEENTRMQVQAHLYGESQIPSQILSHTHSEVPASSGRGPAFSNSSSASGNGNVSQPFQYRVMAPTPPPTTQNPQNPQTQSQAQAQTQNTNMMTKDAPQAPRAQDHILSWAEYGGGADLGFSAAMDGKGKAKDVAG
ncbi:hypothetical protein EYC80_007842 [Monilinia laxa]|uniref:Uncharacterized protein n=1 Tax=Monilinia laxa TaxID=61186 RepID=A0A5N6JU39_MONLA|nr:hypothetical protein EYC80_007842 [Monilinia laxa]